VAYIRLSLLLFIFIYNEARAWDAPWKHASSLSAPWTSETRREGREEFFGKFGQSAKLDHVPVENHRTEMEAVESSRPTESREEMQRLPWSAHQVLYPNEHFTRPLLWPVEGSRLSSGYGIRNGHFHEGLDLAGSEGSTITAVADGRVAFAGQLGTYGRIIVIYHGNGIATVYAHNSANLRLRGARVRKGEAIALVGHTGRAEGAHCHFEIRQDGKPINPLQFTFSKNFSKYRQARLRNRSAG
jgi:murein DD-endopeptidase MepM/ murein hydrolase activator NlpD